MEEDGPCLSMLWIWVDREMSETAIWVVLGVLGVPLYPQKSVGWDDVKLSSKLLPCRVEIEEYKKMINIESCRIG